MSAGEAVARAAEALVGVPFRLNGRDPAVGLDCIGLAAVALRAAGCAVAVPPRLALRRAGLGELAGLAGQAGLAAADGAALPGDVLLVRPGPAQFHLLIAGCGEHFIHAHAGLRRVVATPTPLGWPLTARWRLAKQG